MADQPLPPEPDDGGVVGLGAGLGAVLWVGAGAGRAGAGFDATGAFATGSFAAGAAAETGAAA
jgi:hypothetical protein